MDFASRFQVSVCIFFLPITLGHPIATNKLSLATWGSYYQQNHMGPGTYAFGYDIEDPVTGNIQFKQEERHSNGTITGNYGYVDADGKPHVVTYVADEKGYRVKVEIEGELVKYHPDKSTFYGASSGQQENYVRVGEQENLLRIPLQGEAIDPHVPVYHRLNHPSYYNYVGVNAV